MTLYHTHNSPLIDRIEVTSPRMGITHATIVAKADIRPEQVDALRIQLGAHKFSTLMDNVDGHAAIQVRGIKNKKSFLSALDAMGLTAGGVVKEQTADDKKIPSYLDRVRGKSLFLSSLFYDLGNLAFIVSGIQRGRHNIGGKFTSNDKSEIMIGVAFSLGDVLMTAYSGDKGDHELKAAMKGMKRHLHTKGIAIPDGDTLNPDTLHQSGALKAVDRWLHRYIVQIKCLTELAGGLFTIHAAIKPGNRNNGKLVAGLLIATGWLSTLMLEKPRGDDIYKNAIDKGGEHTVWDNVKNNPRGWIARPLAMANNVSNLIGSIGPGNSERNRFKNDIATARTQLASADNPATRAQVAHAIGKQHDFIWNVISACSFLIAHTLFGLSGAHRPKDTRDDEAIMQDMVLLAANVLTREPEAIRNYAIDQAAEYITTLKHVNISKLEAGDAIRHKVEEISRNTWKARTQTQTASPSLQ